jgi:hypothetical protein
MKQIRAVILSPRYLLKHAEQGDANQSRLFCCAFCYQFLDMRPNGWLVGSGAKYNNPLASWLSLS